MMCRFVKAQGVLCLDLKKQKQNKHKTNKKTFWCDSALGLKKVGCLKKPLLLAYEYFCIISEEGFKTHTKKNQTLLAL